MPAPTFPLTRISFLMAQAIASITMAHAQTSEQVLPQVVVTDTTPKRDNASAIGGFGNAPLMQTPAAISVIGQEQLQDWRIRRIADVIKLDASLNEAYNAVGYAEQFSLRGFPLDNASSYRKDGLPIASDASIPLENKERIDILKGLSGLQGGVSTPGGLIDFVTKRPTATPLRSILFEVSERGTVLGSVDLGGRFEDRRFGYRINAAAEQLRSYVKGADGQRQFISGAFDWQISPKALLQIDLDNQHKSQITAPGYQLIGGTSLPVGVSARTLLNDQPWSKPVVTDSSNIGLRFAYQWNADWSTTVAANRYRLKRDDFAAFPFGCGFAAGFCANGDYDVYDYQSTGEVKTLLSTQAMVQGKFATGNLRHQLTMGVDTLRRRDEYGDFVYDYRGTSNIYQSMVVSPSPLTTGPVSVQRKGNEQAVFVQDIISLTEQVQLHAGLRRAELERVQLGSTFNRSYVLPSIALVYSPLASLSVYGSYSQGLEHGGIAPFGTTNVNQLLDPGTSRQQEIGIKTSLVPNWQMTAALFQISKPLEYTNANYDYVRNGDAVHRGLELAAQGKLSRDLTLGLTTMALQARQRNTGDAVQDNQRVTNVPAFKSGVTLDYAVPQLAGLKLNGAWVYSSDKIFSPDSVVRATIPSYHVVDLGARYVTTVNGIATTLRANVDNVLDKFYWRDASTALGGYLLAGAPRTFKLSAQLDF
ncbi:TonB-dependent siderophore receptor [Actimicrobium sp. CCI2.3]|uniref:TonB-dependent siderophore receptor n=1 Tax=Actimicrobium sp. CCI2.3 TaxID=3048616 RepID=UPI002AB44011|nr:TonB-dependent siderophore receptor [Actimicrobium sp. CCI2.3]MDY7574571.1 TonB-dependent siderophore receptor [Actimicrobium sp. CCI2.3]MEB0020947.1 TonB-dependent siderophore receptor [Actimicrobium sp. CCI2.3]